MGYSSEREFIAMIPEHKQGKQNDITHSITFENGEDARKAFVRAYKRLLNPITWHKLGGLFSAELALFNVDGVLKKTLAERGDLFRINLPGPGPRAGGGYDWVVVEEVAMHNDSHAENEWVGIRLRPSENPQSENSEIAHFFKDSGTSTLIILREDDKVTASYHGRNEIANVNTESTFDNVRNAIIGSSALIGLSDDQWSKLTKAFLEEEIGG